MLGYYDQYTLYMYHNRGYGDIVIIHTSLHVHVPDNNRGYGDIVIIHTSLHVHVHVS